MNEWTNERKKEQKNVRKKEWMNEWVGEWTNEWTQTAYLPTAHISVVIITVLAHWTSNIWHHKCYCSLKSNTSHTIFLYFNDNLHTKFHITSPSGLLDIRLTIWKRISYICHIIITHYMGKIAFTKLSHFLKIHYHTSTNTALQLT